MNEHGKNEQNLATLYYLAGERETFFRDGIHFRKAGNQIDVIERKCADQKFRRD